MFQPLLCSHTFLRGYQAQVCSYFVPCEPFCVLDAFENIALMPFGQSMLCIWLACDALPLDLRLP